MGPFAVDGSITVPPCVISTSPSATRRRAAARAGSIKGRQSSPFTARAASLGQMVAERGRRSSRSMMAAASCESTAETFRARQRSLQYFTSSQ